MDVRYSDHHNEYYCCCYLQVYNGSDALAPVITQACGRNIPDPIFSSGNSLFLEFMTDNSLTMKGFDITYTSSPNGKLNH